MAKYGIQMDLLITEKSLQSGKKPVLCKLGLLSTNIRGREQSDQESATNEKIALAHEHNRAPITSTSAHEVARISTRRLGHPARIFRFFSQPPTPLCVCVLFVLLNRYLGIVTNLYWGIVTVRGFLAICTIACTAPSPIIPAANRWLLRKLTMPPKWRCQCLTGCSSSM